MYICEYAFLFNNFQIPSRTEALTNTTPHGDMEMRSSSTKRRNNAGETRNCDAPNSNGEELHKKGFH